MERQAPAYRLQLLAILDSGKISTFRDATNETRNMTHFSLAAPTFGHPKAAIQYSVQQLRQEDPASPRNQPQYQAQQHEPQKTQQPTQNRNCKHLIQLQPNTTPPAAAPVTLKKPTQYSSPEEKRAYFQNIADTEGCVYCKRKGHLRNMCLSWYAETPEGQRRKHDAPWAYDRTVRGANGSSQQPSQQTPSFPRAPREEQFRPRKEQDTPKSMVQRNRPTDYESFMTLERWDDRCTVCTRIGHKGRFCKFHTNLCALCGEMDSNNHIDFTKCKGYGTVERDRYHCDSNWDGNPAKATILPTVR